MTYLVSTTISRRPIGVEIAHVVRTSTIFAGLRPEGTHGARQAQAKKGTLQEVDSCESEAFGEFQVG